MIENESPTPVFEAGNMSIVPSPIVIFTRDDAIRAARQAPIKELTDHENAVIVMSSISPEGVISRRANFVVTHHVQSRKGKQKMRVMGSWEVKGVPVTRGQELHIFNVAWPKEDPV